MIDASDLLAVDRISFDALGMFSDLFCAYTQYDERVAPFYAGDYRSLSVRAEHAERVTATDRPREAVVEALRAQQVRWGGVDAAQERHLNDLLDPASVAIVTGQQVGVAGGPLYTIYKTITALQWAQQIREETGRPAVPVFWMATGDHDIDEITSLSLQHRNEVVRLTYDAPRPELGNTGPVGRLQLTEAIAEVLEGIDDALVPTDFKPAVMELVRTSYAPGTTLDTAFATLLRGLFKGTGLLIMSPDDPAMKRLAQPLFRKELETPEVSTRAVEARSAQLAETFHAQVHVRATNLFLVTPRGRFPIDVDNDGFVLRHDETRFTRAELLDLLEVAPVRFSPNVVFRPLMQDLLLPTLMYVGGPSEIAYFGQYSDVYDWAGLPMPLIVPRASVTLVEPKVQKVLTSEALSLTDLTGDFELLYKRLVLEAAEVDVKAVFESARAQLNEAMSTLKPSVTSVDQSLSKSVEATRAALMKELGQLQGRVVRAEKKNHDILRAQLEKVRVNLMPEGGLQERLYSALYYLNKYDLDLPTRLMHSLSTDTTEHQVVSL